jgi:hypothetical protein
MRGSGRMVRRLPASPIRPRSTGIEASIPSVAPSGATEQRRAFPSPTSRVRQDFGRLGASSRLVDQPTAKTNRHSMSARTGTELDQQMVDV